MRDFLKRHPTDVAAIRMLADDYPGCLIAPGFVDTHVHYVQTGMIASYGTQLLDWLDRYLGPVR